MRTFVTKSSHRCDSKFPASWSRLGRVPDRFRALRAFPGSLPPSPSRPWSRTSRPESSLHERESSGKKITVLLTRGQEGMDEVDKTPYINTLAPE